jgi:hypothetical protein
MRRYLVLIPVLLSVLVISGCTQQPTTLSWCVAGETWSGDPGNSSEVIGAATYRGQTRCNVTLLIDPSEEVTINMYILDEEGNDVWITMTHPTIGTKAAHIVNEQCTEGDCAYFVGTATIAPSQ